MSPRRDGWDAAVAPRRLRGSAQRSVIVGTGVAGLAALAVMLVVGRLTEAPAPDRPPSPAPAAAAAPAADGFGPADFVLVWGEVAGPLRAEQVTGGAPLAIDLALPVAIDAGVDVLSSRMIPIDGTPLSLEGTVHGDGRDRVRLDVPPGWLARGSYLIEVRTTERIPLPVRRFALIVE